eukprot:TRINITY_DN14493_c0_g1_i1.p1 TRINITY_DN14493_c0_g1~~TRINITY_DN14493_c0_g1_i1.p1  ORF type:complete len:441 (-),score=72.03 TRINITY_DN14493_c0_g1_i1:199-1521(-)
MYTVKESKLNILGVLISVLLNILYLSSYFEFIYFELCFVFILLSIVNTILYFDGNQKYNIFPKEMQEKESYNQLTPKSKQNLISKIKIISYWIPKELHRTIFQFFSPIQTIMVGLPKIYYYCSSLETEVEMKIINEINFYSLLNLLFGYGFGILIYFVIEKYEKKVNQTKQLYKSLSSIERGYYQSHFLLPDAEEYVPKRVPFSPLNRGNSKLYHPSGSSPNSSSSPSSQLYPRLTSNKKKKIDMSPYSPNSSSPYNNHDMNNKYIKNKKNNYFDKNTNYMMNDSDEDDVNDYIPPKNSIYQRMNIDSDNHHQKNNIGTTNNFINYRKPRVCSNDIYCKLFDCPFTHPKGRLIDTKGSNEFISPVSKMNNKSYMHKDTPHPFNNNVNNKDTPHPFNNKYNSNMHTSSPPTPSYNQTNIFKKQKPKKRNSINNPFQKSRFS